MDNIYENFELNKTDSSQNCHSSTERKTEDDVYVNAQEQCQTAKKCTATSSFYYKIIISALTLLMLGALMSLCAVGILYYNNVISTEILNEKYKNATAMLMGLEHKAKEKESTYEIQIVKYQEIISACNETQKIYEELEGNCQQVRENLSACNAQQIRLEGEWKTLGLKSYFFSAFNRNWANSRDYCVEKGGHLVIINSQAEQDLVSSQIGETHWIGLNDLETEGVWMWVNNQPLKKTGVMYWFDAPEGPHEPDNWKVQDPSGENCVALGDSNGNTHKWFDASCQKLKKYICEK